MHDYYDFESVEEKRDYIESNGSIESVDGFEQETFYCPACNKAFSDAQEALCCCTSDCREQTDEVARDRNLYEKTED